MDKVLLRERYGDNFVTVLPSGTIVPWKVLSIGDFIKYDRLLVSGYVVREIIEDEIFEQCVLNPILIQQRKQLPAGTISTVVANIIAHSGPTSIDDLGYLLDVGRGACQQVLHQIVAHISQAFPAYKLEEIYDMDMLTMMLRLAQAEDKLMKLGMMQEPLEFFSAQEQPQQRPKRSRLNNIPDLKQEFDAQQSPPPPTTSSQTVISDHDMKESVAVYTGHEQEDRILLEHNMIQETQQLPHIQEYLKELEKKGTVSIKSEEERREEALQRAKKHQKFVKKVEAEKTEQDRKQLQEVAQVLRDKSDGKRPKKRKRPPRRKG